jgi:hypothetical protein
MVFCSVDLDCTYIYGLLLARIGDSPVNKGCNSGDDQEYSSDLHDCSRSFQLRDGDAFHPRQNLAMMRQTLDAVC